VFRRSRTGRSAASGFDAARVSARTAPPHSGLTFLGARFLRETAAGVVRHVLVDTAAIRLLFLLAAVLQSAVSDRHFQGHR
jgi:hypothetical protein